MTVIVGIAGRAGAGKSAAANALARSGMFDVVSFATPIKEMAAAFLMAGFGYSRTDVDIYLQQKQRVIHEIGVSMRHILQTLGTEWGRQQVARDLWILSAEDRIYNRWEAPHIVIDDVRFEDEAAFIRDHGGLLIHLVRPVVVLGDGHVSEAGVTVGVRDVVIVNDGSLDDLGAAICRAVDRFVSGGDRLLELCLTPCADYRG